MNKGRTPKGEKNMNREEYEELTMEELVDIINDYDGFDIITREEFEEKAKEDIDSGDYDDAIEKLRELNKKQKKEIKDGLLRRKPSVG